MMVYFRGTIRIALRLSSVPAINMCYRVMLATRSRQVHLVSSEHVDHDSDVDLGELTSRPS